MCSFKPTLLNFVLGVIAHFPTVLKFVLDTFSFYYTKILMMMQPLSIISREIKIMEKEKAIVYDYKTVSVRRDMEPVLIDTYENLGWEVIGTSMQDGSLTHVNVSFKRNRKIAHKLELIKLQNKIDTILATLGKLNQSKRNAGVPEGLTTGVCGALVFGGGMSMCMCLSGVGYMIGGIALGVAGMGILLLGWLVHNKCRAKKLLKLEPAIEEEFNKLSDLCEEGHDLLKDA